jgi:hypothetical protein
MLRPSPRTNRTRRVPQPVLTGHAASLTRSAGREVRGQVRDLRRWAKQSSPLARHTPAPTMCRASTRWKVARHKGRLLSNATDAVAAWGVNLFVKPHTRFGERRRSKRIRALQGVQDSAIRCAGAPSRLRQERSWMRHEARARHPARLRPHLSVYVRLAPVLLEAGVARLVVEVCAPTHAVRELRGRGVVGHEAARPVAAGGERGRRARVRRAAAVKRWPGKRRGRPTAA